MLIQRFMLLGLISQTKRLLISQMNVKNSKDLKIFQLY